MAAKEQTKNATPTEGATPTPNCINCDKFFGARRTRGYCSHCYVEITGDRSLVKPSPLAERRTRAVYIVHFAANYKEEVIDPLSFAILAKKFLTPRLKAGTVTLSTLRVLLLDHSEDDPTHIFILADSAHYLINILKRAKCPIANHHLVQHLVFSHVLDTWNISPSVSSVGACYYGNYGQISGSTFGDIKKHTLGNIAEADMIIKKETSPDFSCMVQINALKVRAAGGAGAEVATVVESLEASIALPDEEDEVGDDGDDKASK